MRRHPTRSTTTKPTTPPSTSFYVIAVVAMVFTMLGLVMVLSATSISQFHKGNSPWRIFNRQLMWAVLGTVGLWIAMRVPTHRWRRLVVPGFIGACGLMVLPFLPGIGDRVNEAELVGRHRPDQLPAQSSS